MRKNVHSLQKKIDRLRKQLGQLIAQRNKLQQKKRKRREIADNKEVILKLLNDPSTTYESLAKELKLTTAGLKQKVFWGSGRAAKESGNPDIQRFHDLLFTPDIGPVKALKMMR